MMYIHRNDEIDKRMNVSKITNNIAQWVITVPQQGVTVG